MHSRKFWKSPSDNPASWIQTRESNSRQTSSEIYARNTTSTLSSKIPTIGTVQRGWTQPSHNQTSNQTHAGVKGGTWLDHLEKVATAYNKTPHGVTGDPPNDMSDTTTLEQRKIATDGMEHNMKKITQRQAKARKEGGFRTLRGKKRGLRRRIDEATWSKRIHLVTAFPHPRTVEDEEGNSFATKRVKPSR